MKHSVSKETGAVFYALLAAAGKGTRMNTALPKQLLPYRGMTVLEHTMRTFLETGRMAAMIVIIPPDREYDAIFQEIGERLSEGYGIPIRFAYGGRTRGDSVKAGLEEAAAEAVRTGTEEEAVYVLIHDAARTQVSAEIIERNIEAVQHQKAVTTAVPSIDSLRRISAESEAAPLSSELKNSIMETVVLPREEVFAVQTPQSFHLPLIREAYRKAERAGYEGTDDASVAQFAGAAIGLVEGSYENGKITTRKDIPMAIRVGTGYDVHRLAEGRRLILCGVPIPGSRGLLGHSDADVAVHALMDAILGAAGKGDIGRHFPDSDEKYLNADSMKLLAEVKSIAGDITVGNADITIICERPKLAPYIEKMRENIASVLDMPKDAVNVKATTTEGLGFTGRGEGIAALASCTIEGRF